MKNVIIYTDGASKGNPGPGGFGVVLLHKNHRKELSRGYKKTTNNRMELLAVIEGLKALKEKCNVTVFSDSKYVVDAIDKGWLKNWERKGWKKDKNKPISNVDLWKDLVNALKKHDVEFNWVKGHSDNEENKRCDLLAVAAAENQFDHISDENYEKSINGND